MITCAATATKRGSVATSGVPSDARAEYMNRLYNRGTSLSIYFTTSVWPSLIFASSTSAIVRKIECAYAALGSVSPLASGMVSQMRSSLVSSRTTSVSKRSGCLQSLVREASVRQYLRRAAWSSRAGATSGSEAKRRGSVVSETCRGAEAEMVVSRSSAESLWVSRYNACAV